jgi:hypothetical protein
MLSQGAECRQSGVGYTEIRRLQVRMTSASNPTPIGPNHGSPPAIHVITQGTRPSRGGNHVGRSTQTAAYGVRGGVGFPACADFSVQAGDLTLDSSNAEHTLTSELAIAQAGRHQPQHL